MTLLSVIICSVDNTVRDAQMSMKIRTSQTSSGRVGNRTVAVI